MNKREWDITVQEGKATLREVYKGYPKATTIFMWKLWCMVRYFARMRNKPEPKLLGFSAVTCKAVPFLQCDGTYKDKGGGWAVIIHTSSSSECIGCDVEGWESNEYDLTEGKPDGVSVETAARVIFDAITSGRHRLEK